MSERPATGYLRNGDELVITRTVDLSPAEAWEALTTPDRLAAWYGTFSGDPASGRIQISMSAEGETYANDADVLECVSGREFQLRFHGAYPWQIGVEIAPARGGRAAESAEVSLVHYFEGAEMDPSIGPGWEYYLDCFIAAETGGDLSAVSFDDYYPAQAEYYSELS